MKFKIDNDIQLRVLQSQDATTLFELVDKNRLHLRQWLPWLDQSTKEEHSRQFIDSVQDQLHSGNGFACGVFFETDLVGICGYHEINRTDQSVVIGYWLSKQAQGKGVITRCTKFFLDYAFETLSLNKVLIPVAEENEKSRAVCERLGLVSEGVKKHAENLYGKYVNHICYSLSRDQWLATQQR